MCMCVYVGIMRALNLPSSKSLRSSQFWSEINWFMCEISGIQILVYGENNL